MAILTSMGRCDICTCPNRELLTYREVWTAFGTNRKWVWRKLREGVFTAIRMPHTRPRVLHKSIHNALERGWIDAP